VTVAILAVATLATAALSAVVGMGGGVTLLAVMAALLPAPVVVPIHGVVQLTSNGTRTLLLLRHVHAGIFLTYIVPALVGVMVGAHLYMGGPLPWFRPAVGIFILAYLVTMRWQPTLGRLPLWTFAPLGLTVGALASVIGATGPLIAPFFLRDDLDKEQIIGTKAAVQICTHVAKIPAFAMLGFDYGAHGRTIVPLLIAAVAGTWAGRKLLAGISPELFRRAFVTVLVLISVHLIFFGR